MITLSKMKAGTQCRGYVTDCKGHVLFDKGVRDCTGFCLVSKRDNIPDGHPYCPHMAVVDEDGKGHSDKSLKAESDGCFEINGNPSKWTFKKVSCPEDLPDSCGKVY